MEDNDRPSLSADTLQILQQVLKEKAAAKEASAKDAADSDTALKTSESWAYSQFWYDPATSEQLAKELLHLATSIHTAAAGPSPASVRIACLACPSTFKALRVAQPPPWVDSYLFEFDPRFGVFGDRFVQYDFNHPLQLPSGLAGSFDVICLDPPFLSPDCLEGFTQTVVEIRRSSCVPILLCTGAVMAPHAARLLGAAQTRMHVGHANRLSNPFAAFVNYDESGRLGGTVMELEGTEETSAESGNGPTTTT